MRIRSGEESAAASRAGLWAQALVASAAITAGLVAGLLPGSLRPPCLWHRLTGMPCPTCGSLRALALLARGHVSAAWAMQPLVTVLFAAAACGAAYAWGAVAGCWPPARLNGPSAGWRKAGLLLAAAAVAANWIYLVMSGR